MASFYCMYRRKLKRLTFIFTENNMVLSSLKQENVSQETQETVVNERTAGMDRHAKPS